jgi:hypothetical protein
VSDETTLIVGILGGITMMIVLLVRYQRRKEARLAAQTEIELPIQSTWKAAAIIIMSMVPGPVLAGVASSFVDREHTLGVVLVGLALGVAGIFAGVKLANRHARIGLLRYTPARLELQLGPQQSHIELGRPYELDEALGFGIKNMPLQVLVIRQGERSLAFSYMLALGRKVHGDRTVDRYIEPLLNGEARVIHDRLRSRTAR